MQFKLTNIDYSWVLWDWHISVSKLDPIPHFHRGWAMRQWDKTEVNIKDIKRKPDTARRPFKEEDNKVHPLTLPL